MRILTYWSYCYYKVNDVLSLFLIICVLAEKLDLSTKRLHTDIGLLLL